MIFVCIYDELPVVPYVLNSEGHMCLSLPSIEINLSSLSKDGEMAGDVSYLAFSMTLTLRRNRTK